MAPNGTDWGAEVDVLGVWLGGRRVGTLVRLPDDRVTFAFDPTYASDSDRPTLSLGFKSATGGLLTPAISKTKLPPFFANLLPEGPLRTYLATRAGVKEVRDFPLIALLGEDLPGNVIVRSEGIGEVSVPRKMDDASPTVPLKFSLAGVQLKFSAIENAAGGLTIPVTGAGGGWIVKLPSVHYREVPLHEYLMLRLAAQVGIEVPETRLVAAEDIVGLPRDIPLPERQVLALRRFDRTANKRVHIEDFAQVFRVYPDRKYQTASSASLARVLYAESGLEALLEYVRRLVFTVLIGNGDMHLKNWSLIYPDARTPTLAPAYDFVGTVAYLGSSERLALSLSGTRDFAAITMAHFDTLADRVGAPAQPVLETVRHTIQSFTRVWNESDAPGQLPAGQREVMKAHQNSLPLMRA